MTAPRDPDRLIHAFLMEGQTELPDAVYDAVRDRIEQTRQRTFIGPWRTSLVTKAMKYGLAAAAAVVIAILGYQFLGNSNTGVPGATETPHPTATPTPSEPAPSASIDTGFILWNAPGEVAISVIRASGWSGDQGAGILEKGVNGADPPDGAGMIVFEGNLWVYGDPCKWSTTTPDAPATTVDELVAALSAQASRDATAPVDVTVDGYAGKSITLHVPDDAVFANGKFTDCDQGNFGSWAAVSGAGPDPTPSRYSQGPGQIDELWILDVNGVMVVFDTGYYAVTPVEIVDEIRGIVDSATFKMP